MQKNKLTKKQELGLINRYSTAELTEEQVFCFSVTLCDNDIDRDLECFTPDALNTLKELFTGKTGITDHSMRSKDQCARIFHTYLEKDVSRKTAAGEEYIALRARAYMLRTKSNADLIREIEGGIKKEVSISCSMAKHSCSICGADMKTHACKHQKGRTYGGRICYSLLSEPGDAYEWSFVAVPAQRNAGVTKAFSKKEETPLSNPVDIIKSMSAGTSLSDEDIISIKNYISSLEKSAEDALRYRKHLTEEIERLALIALPKVNSKVFISCLKNMDADELRELRKGLELQTKQLLPSAPQLKSVTEAEITPNYTSFKI